MYEIELHDDADAEMREAAAYYEDEADGLGYEFLDEVELGLTRIRDIPLLWSPYEGRYRRYLLKRFPYGIIYRIEGATIYVIAVPHLHRKPGYWKYRE